MLLLVDGPGIGGGLGALHLQLDGQDVTGAQDALGRDPEVGKGAGDVLEDLADGGHALSAEAEAVGRDAYVVGDSGNGRVHVSTAEGIEELHDRVVARGGGHVSAPFPGEGLGEDGHVRPPRWPLLSGP